MGEKGSLYESIFGDGVNWDAVSHQQLWEWFAEPRVQGMHAAVDEWTGKVAGHFQNAADKVNQALGTAGVHWEGQAADSMQQASAPLAQHALLAKEAATTAGTTTLQQVDFARTMAMSIPEPKPAPAQIDLIEATAAGDLPLRLMDVQEREAAAAEAEARARDLARTYDSGTDDAVSALPQFDKAPSATVTKAEPTSADVIHADDPVAPGGGDTDVRRDAGPGSPEGDPGQLTGGPSGTPSPSSVAPPPVVQPGDGTSSQSSTPQVGGPNGGTSFSPGPTPVDIQRPTVATPVGLVPGSGSGQPSPGPRSSTGTPGGRSAGGPGPTAGPGAGGQPAGRGGQTPGPGSAVRGAVPAEGPLAARASAGATGARGAVGTGMAPVGAAGRGRDDEDTERTSPEYLRDYHDTFWDDSPPVAPAVIGDEDDD